MDGKRIGRWEERRAAKAWTPALVGDCIQSVFLPPNFFAKLLTHRGSLGWSCEPVRLDAKPLDIAWLGDGSQLVASCVDGRAHVVDPDEVKVTQTLPAIRGWTYAIAVHPSDNSIVLGGSNGQLRRVALGKEES
jgi:hypothetical protein